MILFDNPNVDLEKAIRQAIKHSVCCYCGNRSLKCTDKDGYNCDLINPIILTVQRGSKEEASSCIGCFRSYENEPDDLVEVCTMCARMYDDFDHYQDFYEE